jgi:hypothetical protein
MSDEDLQPAQSNVLRLIVHDEVNKCLLTHLKLCPFATNQIEPRLRQLENKHAALIGFMFGSGLLGGGLGAAAVRILTGP